jgi:PBP1b-binding outer membrane lipoprotein LpoB
MKYTFLLAVILFSGCAMQTVESQSKKIDDKQTVQTKTKQPVLVELFTSEG